jgi:hypothetical protein
VVLVPEDPQSEAVAPMLAPHLLLSRAAKFFNGLATFCRKVWLRG